MPKKKWRKIFFTGFPGFIGRRLVREILKEERGCDFIFLVQERFLPEAVREVERIKDEKSARGSRFDLLPGDITGMNLGLDGKKYASLLAGVTDVFHLAAIYDLAVPEETARRVNVAGTRNVVEFCRKAKKLKTFVYFSTCYVAGDRTGTVFEEDLGMGQGFKNHYEATKHDAEVVVRDGMREVPTVIVRPSIVVGDSKTGETQKFDGPYFGMVLIDRLKVLQLPLPYLGESMAEVNLVPVDYVTAATVALWKNPASVGKCFQVADHDPALAKTIYSEIIRLLGARGPIGKIPPLLMDVALRVAAVRKFLGVPREVLDYFNHEVRFDVKNTTGALKRTHLKCPYILDYLPVLVEFYKRNKHRKELRWKAF